MADLPSIYSRQYYSWASIKQRCSNQNNPGYKWYGAKGITYDKKWDTFKGFWEDMADGYADNLTIDRINGRGNYEKSNCRWITHKAQCNNRSSNNMVTIDGITKTMAAWCELSTVKPSTVRQRYYVYKWNIKRALGLEENYGK